MLLVEIGGRLLTGVIVAVFAFLVVQWWTFRSGGRR